MWILVSFCAAIMVVTVAGFPGGEMIPLEKITDDLDRETPGWVKVAEFDLTKGDNCPKPWAKITVNGTDVCRSPAEDAGCYSTVFSVSGMAYNEIRGMVRGYQKGNTNAFVDQYIGINGPYVDGVSITLAGSPRKHVWTYASGLNNVGDFRPGTCPCAVIPGASPPSFVGENYYCQSGNNQPYIDDDVYYMKNPLWNGAGCENTKDNCCAKVDTPWFYREFTTRQEENLEVRICTNQPYHNEGVLIDQLALYIQ